MIGLTSRKLRMRNVDPERALYPQSVSFLKQNKYYAKIETFIVSSSKN